MGRLHILFICGLLCVSAARAQTVDVRCDLQAKVREGLDVIEGRGVLTIANRSDRTIEKVLISTYADRYQAPDPALSWNERDLRYARGTSEGHTDLNVRGSFGATKQIGCCMTEVPLQPPLAPGGETSVELEFLTRIPKKRGPFGVLDGVLTIQGGWNPSIHLEPDGPPVPAVYTVSLEAPAGTTALTSQAIAARGQAIPVYSISISRKFRIKAIGRLGHQVLSFQTKGNQLEKLGEALDEAIELYRSALDRPDAKPLDVCFGFLEQRLAAPAVGYLLVSDQAYRVMGILSIFHVRAILDAAFEALLLRDFPELAKEPWVVQFLAYTLRQEYFSRKYGLGKSLRDLIRGPLRLLPAFDELINGADFPGRQFYLHRIELEAERPEDIFSWNTPYPTGALLAERLGRLVGEEPVARLGVAYLKLASPRPTLHDFYGQQAGRDLSWLFEQWLGPVRPVSFRIGSIARAGEGDAWTTDVMIRRDGTRTDRIDVEATLPDSKPHQGWVLLDESEKTYSFQSTVKPGRVSLDRSSQVEESWRADNTSPPRLKLLLYNSRVNLEPKSKNLDALTLLAFLREHDYSKVVFLELFLRPLRFGGSVDLARQFGKRIDPLRYPFSVRAGIGFERTDDDPETGEQAESIFTLRAGFQYDTQNYLDEADQKNDNFAEVLLEAAPGVAVGESSFVQGRLSLTRHQRLNSAWTLSGRVFLGLSGGDVHSNRRFDLGNANMLRGFAAGDVLSEDVLLGSAEVRGDVFRNFDFAFPWGLAFLSRLQLVTFVDAALLSDSPNVFSGGDSAVDVGIGVRLQGRWFGIIPSMGKIDVGYPVDGDENGGFRIYLGVTQAF